MLPFFPLTVTSFVDCASRLLRFVFRHSFFVLSFTRDVSMHRERIVVVLRVRSRRAKFRAAKCNLGVRVPPVVVKYIAASNTRGRRWWLLSVSCRHATPVRSSQSRRSIGELHLVRGTKTAHAARHCIAADTYSAATCFGRCERQCQRQLSRSKFSDRAEITAEKSAGDFSLSLFPPAVPSDSFSSRFFIFFHPPSCHSFDRSR